MLNEHFIFGWHDIYICICGIIYVMICFIIMYHVTNLLSFESLLCDLFLCFAVLVKLARIRGRQHLSHNIGKSILGYFRTMYIVKYGMYRLVI